MSKKQGSTTGNPLRILLFVADITGQLLALAVLGLGRAVFVCWSLLTPHYRYEVDSNRDTASLGAGAPGCKPGVRTGQ